MMRIENQDELMFLRDILKLSILQLSSVASVADEFTPLCQDLMKDYRRKREKDKHELLKARCERSLSLVEGLLSSGKVMGAVKTDGK